jgi:hypothetical protein
MRLSLAAFIERIRSLRAQSPSGTDRLIREVTDQGYRIRLDVAGQVLRISVPERLVFRSPAEGEPLQPTPGHWSGFRRLDSADRAPQFVAAAMLVQKAKQVDDGLCAAVDLAAQRGAGAFPGKGPLLESLASRLAERGDADAAAALILASGRLGGLALRVPPRLAEAVEAVTASFLHDELRSKPLGFYTWSAELKAVFQQDRLLQGELEGSCIRPLVDALCEEPPLRATYEAFLRLTSRLTSPLVGADLRSCLSADALPPDAVSFYPPGLSHEGELGKRLYGDQPIPSGLSLVEELIRRIRSGDLALTPTEESGWHDYQTWAHEPFVIPDRMPEADRLLFERGYREQLLGLFRGAQALARETHVKQLESVILGSASVDSREGPTILKVSPDLTVEPLASYYFRRALGYRFVREVLEASFGLEGLNTMKCLTAEGARQGSLASELGAIEALFRGVYLTSCREIGLRPELSALPDARDDLDRERFDAWAKDLEADPDLGQDARMMVPIFYDRERRQIKVWAFMGWTARTVSVSFSRTPTAQVFDRRGREVSLGADVQLRFDPERHRIPQPETAEVYVTRLLDREEFRRHCDNHKTR